MRRTDDTYKSTDKFGSGKHGFTDGVLDTTPATIVHADDMDHHQEELCRVVEAFGCTPAGSAYSQVLGALQMADLERSLLPQRVFTTPGTATLRAVCGPPAVNLSSRQACSVGDSAAIYRLDSTGWLSDTAGSSYAGNFSDVFPCGSATYNFVACGTSEEIQTFSGGTWTRRNTGSDKLNSIAYDPGNDRVVVVGDNNTIWESTAAVSTWTDRTANSALSGSLSRVIWVSSLGLFVCVGQGIQTSPDGVTWIQRSSETGLGEVIWIESIGYLVAVSSSKWLTSTDGLTWTDTTVAPVVNPSNLIGCAGGLFQPDAGLPIVTKFTNGLPGASMTDEYRAPPQDGAGNYWNAWRYDPTHQAVWACGDNGLLGHTALPLGT